jgi:hypothetical protein
MSAACTTLLHIGTHRTGTTSIQSYLRNEVGAPVFPEGYFPDYPNCHAEWLVASSLDFEHAYRAPTRDKLQLEAASEAPLLVYSCETISTFRDADRVARVRELVGARRLLVVLYTREPKAFLKSYRRARGARHEAVRTTATRRTTTATTRGSSTTPLAWRSGSGSPTRSRSSTTMR